MQFNAIANQVVIPQVVPTNFPSIFDAKPESAIWFLENGMPECAKRVMRNVSRETESLRENVVESHEMAVRWMNRFNDVKDALDSEKENAKYWLNKYENGYNAINAAYDLEREKIQRSLSVANDVIVESDRENGKLMSRLYETENEVIAYRISWNGLSKSYGSLKRKVQSLSNKLHSSQKENEMLRTENKRLENDNAVLRENITDQIEKLLEANPWTQTGE